MSGYPEDISVRASRFAAQRGIRLEDQLGSGVDGIVFRSDRPSAVKVFAREDAFRRELACYQRLKERVLDIQGHRVPQLLDFNDSLLVIEMTVVQRPYLLDFAGGYLDDTAPDFPEEVIEQWHEEKREQFGAARWEKVQLVLATLRRYGIHLLDVNPRNITFGGSEE